MKNLITFFLFFTILLFGLYLEAALVNSIVKALHIGVVYMENLVKIVSWLILSLITGPFIFLGGYFSAMTFRRNFMIS